jgi:predicted Zn-dependent protease
MTSSRLRWLLAMLLALLPTAGCSVNPATGQSSFTGLMSEADEARIGGEEHPKILAQFGGAYDDPQLQRYIDSLGQLLGRTSDRPDVHYTFTVLDSPVVNAFALPGGYVYITRGLLALANDEAEVAGVLAHEIGHVAARHAAARQGQAVLASLPAIFTGVLTGSSAAASAAGNAGQSYLQGYSRDQEYQADLLGVRYMSRANYDPLGMANFLRQLQADNRLDATIAGNPELADQTNIMATHPRTADRIERAIQQAGGIQVTQPIVERDLYLRKIDGILYGDAPEQGFISGRRFAHPILRFAFEVPAGFHMANGARAVMAQRADGALIFFDRAPGFAGIRMIDYLRDEWAPKLRPADAETVDVNGMDAATGSARIDIKSGSADVRLVAIRYDGTTIYRFLFVSKPSLTASLAAEFRQTMLSFRRLSQAEAAALHPQRVRVVAVKAGDTVESLARRMPFDDFQEQRFRVLNGLGAGEALTLGQRVKIVAE